MLEKLTNHLTQNFSYLLEKKVLLAISGGLDSMVLLHLFQKLNIEFAVAHCNFQLRGTESNEDENFVENYTLENKITFFNKQFETEKYAKTQKTSIQISARELRYQWFNELLETENYDYILTAHHADDNLETFLINLSRGTGIDGLTGIPAKNDTIIRPLLLFSRLEIENFAKENNINWREDSSNSSDKYLRNKIRHQVIPALKSLNPNFLESFQRTQTYLQETQLLASNAVNLVYDKVATKIGDEIHFDLFKLKSFKNYKSYLYHFLNKYGFKAWEDIYNLVDSETGKQIFSKKYSLLKNRNYLILSPLNFETKKEQYFIEKNQAYVNFPIKLTFSKTNSIVTISKQTIFVNENKLKFPLEIRRWEKGDYFQPFGMNGQTKKVSKFLKDEKISLIDKQNIWILHSDNQIVWIIGMRQDERFKIETTTTNILQITLE